MRKVLALLVVVIGLASVGSIAAGFVTDPDNRDLAFDHVAARALLHGANPYAPVDKNGPRELPGYQFKRFWVEGLGSLPPPYWHTPVQLLIYLPLAPLPFPTAGVIWTLLAAGCFTTAIVLFGRELGFGRAFSSVVAMGLLVTPLVRDELRFGQIHSILLLLAVLCWRNIKAQRDARAGVWLGIAIAIKVFPGFFLLPLLGMRRFRTVGVAGVLACGTFGVAWLATGARTALFAQMFQTVGAWRLFGMNISWQGLILRATGHPMIVPLIGSIVFSALAVRPPSSASGDRFLAAAPLMILALPLAWFFYLVLLIPWTLLVSMRTRGAKSVAFVLIGIALLVRPVPYAPFALLLAVILEGGPHAGGRRSTSVVMREEPQSYVTS
jgi:hypothetical protein